MKKSSLYFALLLILVIVIAVLGILIVQRKAPAEEPPAPTDAPIIHPPVKETVTAAPEETPEPVIPEETPEPTEPPIFETRPPIETEAPEKTPEPVPADASGSFRSDTGTGLNLKADWKTYTDAGGARKLQVDVSTLSYSFFTSPLYQSIVLTVDGKTYSANSAEVSYDGKDLKETPMASFTVDAPASGSPVSVTWHYKGTYSGKALDEITASGVIE